MGNKYLEDESLKKSPKSKKYCSTIENSLRKIQPIYYKIYLETLIRNIDDNKSETTFARATEFAKNKRNKISDLEK